jgi:thiol:disulfide interchange protein DsbC
MPDYNELGITMNYVMLPRSGLNSASYDKAASVFCSDKPAENMTLAMLGEFDQKNSCDHTITDQYQLAREFGINSTPTMILPDGEIKVGFLTPEALQAVLDTE